MRRICLLLAEDEQRRRLVDWLSPLYQLVLPSAPGTFPDEPFDLCVVDGTTLPRFQEILLARKEAEHPVFLPVLLVTSRQEVERVTDQLWQTVDELLISPVERAELLARIAMLRRVRRLSVENKQGGDSLTRVNKAIENASDAILITDLEGQILYHNRTFSDLFGFTPDEIDVRGLPETLFVSPETGREIFAQALRGEAWNGEVTLRRRDGQQVIALLHVDATTNAAGEMTGIVWSCKDVTDLRRAEVDEREQRLLAEALRDTATALTSTLDLADEFDRILENLGHVVPHDAASVMLLDDDLAYVVRAQGFARYGLHERIEDLQLVVSQTPHLRRLNESRQGFIIPDLQRQPIWNWPQEPGWPRSYLGMPIVYQDEIFGFINLFATGPDGFTPVHADRLRAFAEQAALAVQNARLYEQSRALAVMEERQRLSRDMHDAVSQTLFSATLIAEALPRQWERDPVKAQQRLMQLHQLTRGALAESRTLLFEMRPTSMLSFEFEDLVRQLVEAVQNRKRIVTKLVVEGQKHLAAEIKLALYRIAQEALNNVIKHSHATQLVVAIHYQPESVKLSIQDNGRGFDQDRISPASKGFDIMREHANAIGASLLISSEIGAGTEIVAVWSDDHGKGSSA